MKKQRILSVILVLAMLMSMFTFNISSAQTTDETQAQIDPLDISAFEAYGAYIYAGNSEKEDTMSGLNMLSYDDKAQYDNRIYSLTDDIEEINAAATNDKLKLAYNIATNGMFEGVKYITRAADGAWGYRSIGGKDAFWTTRNIRYDSRYVYDAETGTHTGQGNADLKGSMYVNLTNDAVTEGASNVTFLIEYYDNDASDITMQYINTNFANNGYKGSSAKIDKTGTNTWKVTRIQVTDAKLDKDWTKTGLGNGTACVKFLGSGSDYYISKILIIPTSTYNNIINPPTYEDEVPDIHNDGIDWWELARTKGVYIDAANPDAGYGISANLSNRLYDLKDADDLASFGDSLSNKKTASEILAMGYQYATLGGTDGGAKISSATSRNGIKKTTFLAAKNHRNSTSYNVGGSLYFAVTSDAITSADDDVYVVMEYLDYDANMTTILNSNGTENYKGQSTITPYFAVNPDDDESKKDFKEYPGFYRHNTNQWRTVAIPLTGSELTNKNTATGLSDNKHDIKISVNNVATHVSRVGIVKASDVGAAEHVYHAPKTQGEAPTIWLAGDSIVETLDAKAYPREGWGMELGNYFIKESTGNADTYAYDDDGFYVVAKHNEGVTVINRAKGGKSTRTFLNQVDPTASATTTDTRWDDIKNGAKPGDYLFVSFFINDVGNRTTVQTNPFLVSDSGDRFAQRANIKEFKDECDKLGINLVLVTPASGRGMGANQDAHIASVTAQAKELGVPLVDVRTYHKALISALKAANSDSYDGDKTKLIFNHISDKEINPEYSASLGYADDTHVNQTGAKEICKIIIQEIQRKSTSFESMEQLAKWIDPDADIKTMEAPKHQEEVFEYTSAQQTYIVNGEESDEWDAGEVALKITVKNVLDTDNDATAYLALYKESGEFVKVVKSEKATIKSGESATLTTSALSVPTTAGYKLRKYVWNSKLSPVQLNKGYVAVDGQGFNRRATLTWSVSKDLEGATYEIYRDGLKIGETTGYGFTDEKAERGSHLYQINALDESGDIIGQSAYAAVIVTGLYDLKKDKDVFFMKANIDAMGKIANVSHGINLLSGGEMYLAKDAKDAMKLTDADIEASYGKTDKMYQGAPYVGIGGDSVHLTMNVKDKYGEERIAWMTSLLYRTTSKNLIQGYVYVTETNDNNFTENDKELSVFIEYLANKEAPDLQYYGYTVDNKGTDDTTDDTLKYEIKTAKATGFSGITGDWRIARYDIKDAYFCEDTPFSSDSMFRFASGNKAPSYISSVLVVKGSVQKANTVIANLNNMEFSNVKVRNGASKYPDGISIDFTSGEAVKNGMDVFYNPDAANIDAHGEINTADGVGYYGTLYTTHATGGSKQPYLYFKADHEYIFGASDKMVVEVTYKADYDTELYLTMLNYDRKAGVSATSNRSFAVAKLYKNESDNWQTVKFEIENPNGLYLDNAGALFRLNIPQSEDDPEKQLKISKISVKNASDLGIRYANEGNSEGKMITVHIAADSIAAQYTAEQIASKGIYGWGMVLGDYLNGNVMINNKATPGASTVTFSNMPSIIADAKEGDYVLISFGHNDQMSNKWVEIEDYKANLSNWISQIREKKAIPVLVTMIPQGQVSTGVLRQSSSFDDRRKAVAEVAAADNVMLVKLGEQMFADEAAGVLSGNYVTEMYCDEGADNRTHLIEKGARYVAGIIVNSMKSQSTAFAKYVK